MANLLKIEWFSGTGAGGQHRNKHQNCCRLSWEAPDGRILRTSGTESKSRESNKSVAIKRMKTLIASYLVFLKDKDKKEFNQERIRTYNKSDNRVVDHASGLKVSYKECMEKSGFGKLIEARNLAILTLE